MITLEADLRHVQVARENIAFAGLSKTVDVRHGTALELLPQLQAPSTSPFDLTFIDADKASAAEYFAWAMNLSHTGSVIIVDNVVRGGALIESVSMDLSVQGVRRFHEAISADDRAHATTIQTVGSKGYDGFTMVLVGDARSQ